MSKNTGNTNFRKLNVSPYSDDESDQQEATVDESKVPSDSEIQSMLNSKRNGDALKLLIENPPINSKDVKVKERALALVMQVLTSFKSSEIDALVQTLDQPALDTLMKYIYRGFENPSEGSSALLLTWHEKAFAVGGVGSIVRVLTDRKRV